MYFSAILNFFFVGALAKLFSRGTYCEVHFLELSVCEINCYMWEEPENTVMHLFCRRSLKLSLYFLWHIHLFT